MRVIASVAMSVDGYIDSAEVGRLKLSSAEDFYDVHVLRAECDAILVGSGTVRKDNPSLITKHEKLLKLRKDKGLNDDPIKITMTRTGEGLLPESQFFNTGDNEKWVFCHGDFHGKDKFSSQVRFFDWSGDMVEFLSLLEKQGIKTLLIEGGQEILTQFLSLGLVEHLRLAVAPFFVGNGAAPQFVGDGIFPHGANNRMQLLSVRSLGDMVVIDYGLGR